MRMMMRTCLEVKEFSVHLINDEKGGGGVGIFKCK